MSISQTCLRAALQAQILKVYKFSQVVSFFLRFWDLNAYIKALNKMFMKLTTGVNFSNILQADFKIVEL